MKIKLSKNQWKSIGMKTGWMKTIKTAKAADKINRYNIQDPYIIFFINLYENLIDWNQVKSIEDINNLIQYEINNLIEKANPDSENNYYIKDIDLEKEIRNFGNNPNEQQRQVIQYARSDPEEAKTKLLEIVNNDKQKSFNEWINYITKENDIYQQNPAFQYVILRKMLDTSKENSKNPIIPLKANAVAELFDEIKNSNGKPFNVVKSYCQKSKEESISTNFEGNKENITGWKIVPSKIHDPENYENNKKELMSIASSSNSGWCIAGEGMADTYLSKGDFHIYFENGNAVVAIRLIGYDEIAEIQGKNNKRPFPYWETILQRVDQYGLDKNSAHYKELEESLKFNEDYINGKILVDDYYRYSMLSTENRESLVPNEKLIKNLIIEISNDLSLYDNLDEKLKNIPKIKNAYDESVRITNEHIARKMFPPSFSKEWAKNKLDNGEAPQEWINAINNYIKTTGFPPPFAKDWYANKLDSEEPQEWVNAITKKIVSDKRPHHSSYGWVEKKLDNNEAPKEWINVINDYIASNGNPPHFAKKWVENKLKNNDVDQALLNGFNKHVAKNGFPPPFAKHWCIKRLNDEEPQEWINAINNYILSNRSVPSFAKDWVNNKLDDDKPPPELLLIINDHIEQYGWAPDFAKEWAKTKLNNNEAPQEWINKINDYIKIFVRAPNFAEEWVENKLDNNEAPQEWLNVITKYIEENGYPPNFAEEWVKKQNQPINPVQAKSKSKTRLWSTSFNNNFIGKLSK